MDSFKKTLLAGSFYIGIAKYAGIICQLVITAVLARILTPEDYGIIAMATVFIVFFNTLSDIGIGVAVIQRRDFSDKDLDHLFSLNIYIGVCLAVLFFSLSGCISAYYNNEQLLYVCQLLSMLIFFTCARTVPMNLLYREKKFKYIAFTNFAVQVACGVAAIVAALYGWGVYSLVLSQVLSAFLLFVIYTLKYNRHFYLLVDFTPLKRCFSYSAYNFASCIFIYFTLNVDKILVGKYIGTTQLGYYEKSYSLVFLPINNITFVVTPVLHPLFSEYQNDYKVIAEKFLRIIAVLAYVSFILSVICFFVSKELILIFYGHQWYDAIPTFKIMSLAISFLMLDTTVGSIYNAANQTHRAFYTMIIMALVMISSIIVSICIWKTLIAVAYAFLFAKVIGTIVNFYSLMRGLETPFSAFINVIFKPIIISAILFLILYVFTNLVPINNIFMSLVAKTLLAIMLALLVIQCSGAYNFAQIANKWISKPQKNC